MPNKRSKTLVAIALSTGLLAASNAFAGACYVHVTWSDGDPRPNAKVQGSVSWGGMTKKVSTDDDGDATLRWSSDNDLVKVFVNGRNYGGCRNGYSKTVVTY